MRRDLCFLVLILLCAGPSLASAQYTPPTFVVGSKCLGSKTQITLTERSNRMTITFGCKTARSGSFKQVVVLLHPTAKRTRSDRNKYTQVVKIGVCYRVKFVCGPKSKTFSFRALPTPKRKPPPRRRLKIIVVPR